MTDQQIDELLKLLDHAAEKQGPGYGLPVFDENERQPLRHIVREWLAAQQR